MGSIRPIPIAYCELYAEPSSDPFGNYRLYRSSLSQLVYN
jgi:hypothetical protein